MKKVVASVLSAIAVFLALPSATYAEQISSFKGRIDIRKDGTIRLEERIDYDFADEERHGILRTIPLIKTNEEGKKFTLALYDFSVTDAKNYDYPYSISTKQSEIILKIGDPNRTIQGKHVYAISYEVAGAISYFSDHDELYWNVTGNGWDVSIDESVATVILPQEISGKEIRIACFTGQIGSTGGSCDTSYDEKNRSVQVKTRFPLAPGEGLTVAIGFPKGVVAVLEPKEYVPFWDSFWGRVLLGLIILAAILWYIVLPLVLPILWWRYGRDPSPSVGEATAWFEPPKGRNGRLLTPAETGTLVDERADTADITAAIIDMARRGYLRIVEKKKGDIELEKVTRRVNDDELQPYEEILLEGLFKDEDAVTLKSSSLVKVMADTKRALYASAMAEGFFPKNPETIRTTFSVASAVALVTGNFLLFLSILFFGYHMPRKTFIGAQAATIARSLKNFIISQERQFTFQAEKQLLFEKMLPFAIVFGVEKIWIARFAQMHLSRPQWYRGYSADHFNAGAFTDSMRSMSTGISRAATPTSSSRGFSSGFSGGSSGGGGGGGGGGSW